MDTATTALDLAVTATDRDSMDLQLEAAVTEVRERAIQEGRKGILITRHAPGSFTVALSDEVPYGLTQERDLRN